MKKFIIIGIITVVVALLSICIICYIKNTNNKLPDKGNINLELIDTMIVDTAGISKRLGYKDYPKFTIVVQIKNPSGIKNHLSKEFHLEILEPKYDYYDDKYLIFTIGRKIVDINYEYLGKPFTAKHIAKAEITLEEEYHSNTMFVYSMDKILL